MLALWMALHSEVGAVRVLGLVPGLTVQDARGQLWGDFQAKRLVWRLPRGGQLVLLEPRWQGLDLAWAPQAPWRLALSMRSLQAESADLHWVADPKAPPLVAPQDLQLPVALKVDALRLARLTSNLWADQPITGLQVQLALQQPQGVSVGHLVQVLALQWQGWQAQGVLQAQARGELAVSGSVEVSGHRGLGRLVVSGRVVSPELQGRVSLADGAQGLDVKASLRPFEPWPVQQAQATAQGLDLQGLLPSLPHTALTGQVLVMPRDAMPGAPGTKAEAPGTLASQAPEASDLLVRVDLRNEQPGLWDAAAIPLSAAKGTLTLPAQAKLQAVGQVGRSGLLDAMLTMPGQAGRARGTLTLQGTWDVDHHERTRITMGLDAVDLRALDSRSPPLRLLGQMALQGQTQSAASGAAPAPTWSLEGRLDGLVPRDATGVPPSLMGQAAQADFKLQGAREQWQLTRLNLRSGAAQAQVTGQWQGLVAASGGGAAPSIQQRGSPDWQGDLQVSLQAFDPAMWMPWPRPPGDALQKTRLDGALQAHLSGPSDVSAWWQAALASLKGAPGRSVATGAAAPGLSAVQGKVSAELKDSQLLGVPVSAQWLAQTQSQVQPQSQPQAPVHTETGWQFRLDLASGSNTLKLDASLPLQSSGQWGAPQLRLDAHVPALQAWQAWAKPLGWSELAGQLVADADMRLAPGGSATGKGRLKLEGFKALRPAGAAQVQSLTAQWQFEGGAADARGLIDAQVLQARWGNWQVPQAQLHVQGPRSQHAISLQALAVLPPRKQAGGDVVAEHVKLDWQAQAALTGQGDGLAWSAKVQSLQVLPEAKGAQPWFAVEPFELAWQPLAQAGAQPLHRWRISPTRASLFGAALGLRQAQWRPSAQGADTAVEIALEPLKLAEVLGRWQPQVGWGGDLLVTGQLKVNQSADGRWRVDAGLARQSGDLTLREPGINGVTEQTLGIRAARLSLQGQDGIWRLSEQLDARVLGQVQGEQRLLSQGPAELPRLSDALSGQISFKLDNLRTVSVWAPAGWRLGGKASADLQITGSLGAPGMLGRLIGQDLAISNPLMGVQVNRGDLVVAFRDRDIAIERFSASSGEGGGKLDATGRAAVMAEDVLYELQLKASRFALLNRVDRKAVVSGDLSVQVTHGLLKADGQMRVDEGLVDISQADAPTVGDDVNVVNRPGVPDEDDAGAPGRKLAISLGLDLGQQLRLKGRGLDTRLAGQVRLSTPNGRTHVQGTLQALDGTYAAYGQRLQIERGTIAFTGSVDNPRLDIQAMRPQSPTAAASDVKVGVLITGTAQDPRVRLYSEPSMSETEKLSWLVLGRAPAGLNGADIGLLQTAAYALLDGEGPSVHDNLIKTLGLDELSVRQTDGAVRDTIVAVGKQVSSKWYVGYERSLNATAGTWQAIYRLAQRFTVRLQSGDDNAIDLIWSKRWGE